MSTKLITMRIFLLTILLSLNYANYSYNGLLLPNSTYHLVSNDSDYLISKRIFLDSKYIQRFSSHFITFPNSINMGIFDFYYNIKSYKTYSSLYIINYGDFEDSESGYTFSSKDYIVKSSFSKDIHENFYSSFDFKYLYSNIDTYKSSALVSKISLFYYNQRFLIQIFMDNYGYVINKYTNFEEELPNIYGYKLMFKPKYINAIITAKHDYFINYNIINFSTELFLFNNSSILMGFSSLSKDLYYNEFYNDFFTGVSFGISTKYKNYLINLGFQNLGSIGVSSAFTISKLINK